jgi:hypothetical protein
VRCCVRIFRTRAGSAAIERAEVEETPHKGPAHGHVGNKNRGTCFTNIPVCPHGGEGVCEGVIFVENGAEDLNYVSDSPPKSGSRGKVHTTKTPRPNRQHRMSFL